MSTSSIPHGAPFASGAVPIPISEGIGEGIGETLARLADRLAVVAVSAHIMERRHTSDCYARSIARESRALAVEARALAQAAQAGAPMRAPRIVDAASSTGDTDGEPDAPPAQNADNTPPDGEHIGELCPFPGCRHWYNDPCADCLEVERQKRRQTPPEARHTAPRAGDGTQRTPARHAPRVSSQGSKGARHA